MASRLMDWMENKINVINQVISNTEIKTEKYNYPFYYDLLSTNNDVKGMKEREFNNPEEVLKCFAYYRSLIVSINKNELFVPTIENFCMFMGWTARVYKQMLNDTSIEIMEVMHMVDDYIVEAQLSAGQTGWTKANLTKFRTQTAGEHGHALVTQKEQNEEKHRVERGKGKEQMLAELRAMGGLLEINPNKK